MEENLGFNYYMVDRQYSFYKKNFGLKDFNLEIISPYN
jgi:hypothetical protein